MEELTIWEQHTITLNKDSKVGFGFAISGGKDKPRPDNGDTGVVVSDVLPNGPAMGRLFNKDQIVMVNGVSMENVNSNYTIQTLKTCGKTANITVKRPRKIQIPATSRPSRAASQSNLLDHDNHRQTRRYSDSSDNRDGNRYPGHSPTNGQASAPLLMSSGYKRLPYQDFPSKPVKTTLVKKKIAEYGLKLGSQIFIKHMTETGLAAKEGTLQEGDLILKINGMTTENLSLLETQHLVEKSRGKLTMTVLRDDRKFLVNIPEVEDSAPNSEDDRRRDSSSELEDISDIDVPTHRASRQPTKDKRTRRQAQHPEVKRRRKEKSPLQLPSQNLTLLALQRNPNQSQQRTHNSWPSNSSTTTTNQGPLPNLAGLGSSYPYYYPQPFVSPFPQMKNSSLPLHQTTLSTNLSSKNPLEEILDLTGSSPSPSPDSTEGGLSLDSLTEHTAAFGDNFNLESLISQNAPNAQQQIKQPLLLQQQQQQQHLQAKQQPQNHNLLTNNHHQELLDLFDLPLSPQMPTQNASPSSSTSSCSSSTSSVSSKLVSHIPSGLLPTPTLIPASSSSSLFSDSSSCFSSIYLLPQTDPLSLHSGHCSSGALDVREALNSMLQAGPDRKSVIQYQPQD